MNTSLKKNLLRAGLTFQLFGLLAFLSYWIMGTAIAFFVVGAILLLLSGQKWYFTTLSLLPMCVALFLMTYILQFEKFIIPSDFTGDVIVITDLKNGAEKEYDFFNRVYRIPASGILFTKFNQGSGINKRSFYQTDKNGELQKMGVLTEENLIVKGAGTPDKTGPLSDSLAVLMPRSIVDFSSKVSTTLFTVGKYKDIKDWNEFQQETIDSLKSTRAKLVQLKVN